MNWDVLDTFWQAAWPKIFDFGKALLIALLIWIIGKKLIKMAVKLTKRAFDKASIDDGVESFLLSMIRIVLYGVLVVILAGTVGIETGSIIALLGSAGLAIGLSLVLVHLVCIHYTGTSVNPARSIGPAVLAGGQALSDLWIFIVAPLVGAALAAGAWKALTCECKCEKK